MYWGVLFVLITVAHVGEGPKPIVRPSAARAAVLNGHEARDVRKCNVIKDVLPDGNVVFCDALCNNGNSKRSHICVTCIKHKVVIVDDESDFESVLFTRWCNTCKFLVPLAKFGGLAMVCNDHFLNKAVGDTRCPVVRDTVSPVVDTVSQLVMRLEDVSVDDAGRTGRAGRTCRVVDCNTPSGCREGLCLVHSKVYLLVSCW